MTNMPSRRRAGLRTRATTLGRYALVTQTHACVTRV
jgi:hypothetical protein